MPDIAISEFLPMAPLHWTSIMHYLVLITAIISLLGSGDDAPMLYILALFAVALLTATSLYLNFLSLPRLFVFLIRVIMLAFPLILAGMGPTESTRQFGILMALVSAPILAITLFGCLLGTLGDPRIALWCFS